MPSRRSWRKSRLVLRAWVFTFPSWTRTSICQVFWRDFLGRDDGWRRGWAELVASGGARPSEPHRWRTGGWVVDRRRWRGAELVTTRRVDSIDRPEQVNSRFPSAFTSGQALTGPTARFGMTKVNLAAKVGPSALDSRGRLSPHGLWWLLLRGFFGYGLLEIVQ